MSSNQDVVIDGENDPPSKAYWFCDECGHADHQKPLPPDRALFYANLDKRRERTGDGGYKCPRCKSMSLLPKGY